MRSRNMALILAILLLAVPAWGSGFSDLVEEGNDAFRSGDYQTALESYHAAEIDLPESSDLEYNMAAALHRQGNYEEAVERYTKALNSTDMDAVAAAHYNLGNTHFRAEDYKTAIESYQNSLEARPDNIDAKYNLELARRILKDQPPKQEQEQDEQQQQQQEEEQQEQEQQQQEEQQQEQQQQQQQEKKDDQQPEQEQKQQPEPKEMSKEDAERILNALQDDEQEIQKKVKRAQRSTYTGKDW